MSVVEQVFGNLLVVESDVPDIWDFRHLASRQPPNVGTCEAYNASKWLCEFNCVMPTITPGVNDSPNGPLRQQSCPMLKHFFPLGFSQGLTQNESSGIRRSFLRKRESR